MPVPLTAPSWVAAPGGGVTRKAGAREAVAAGATTVALTLDAFLVATAASPAPAFWTPTAVAVRTALFLGALLSLPPFESQRAHAFQGAD
jgi:hypothetical protein